jgi:hypothetical protein
MGRKMCYRENWRKEEEKKEVMRGVAGCEGKGEGK